MLNNALLSIVQKYPQKTALLYGEKRVLFEQMYCDICRFTHGLSSIGIKQGDCVALLLPNCPEFIIGFYAIAKLACIVLPINPVLKEDEIKYYIKDCNAKAIITMAQQGDVCKHIIGDLGGVIQLIIVDRDIEGAIYFYDLLQQQSSADVVSPPHKGVVLYQFSSGSTGRPKRVVRTQENLFHEAHNFTSTVHVIPDDAILCLVPLFHAHGLGNCLLAATTSGALLAILEQPMRDGVSVEVPFVSRCPRVFELLQNEGITILPGVPYVFHALAETFEEEMVDLSRVRLCFSAGNFLPRQVFDAFFRRFGIPVRQLYGCTEAGSVTINLAHDVEATWNAVGQPLGMSQVFIVDEQMRELPCDQVGEIVIESLSLTDGYFNMPEVNAEVFRAGRFLTGDLGRRDAQGLLYITGRKKIFIDTGGHKVDPLEVEEVLVAHPHVLEAVVVGVESPYGGEVVKAVVVVKAVCGEDELVAYCRSRLADFKVPRIVSFIDEIPKSPLGKVLRKNLVHMQDGGQERFTFHGDIREVLLSAESAAQRQALIERALKDQIRQLLRLDDAAVDSLRSLSEFGLTSVLALEFKVRLEEIFGLPLSAALVWNYPNIAALAMFLDGAISTHQAEDRCPEGFVDAGGGSDIDEVEQLSDDEAMRLFMHELERFDSRMGLTDADFLADDDGVDV